MSVHELIGKTLNYWVARAEGLPLCKEWDSAVGESVMIGNGAGDLEEYCPATNWSQGGPIIEREHIELAAPDIEGGHWVANPTPWPNRALPFGVVNGPTPLIAAMRAFVALKFGETLPE